VYVVYTVRGLSAGCSCHFLLIDVQRSIWYDTFINCSWVVTRCQYTFTHKQYI